MRQWAKNRHFTAEEIQMAKKHMKRCGHQGNNKPTIGYNHTPIREAQVN